ncbi:nucleotide-diphospho-sugar transferase [Bombardia bombarda]|uniref:Nucleotide-diphospho-sugar transferase n=1 Tax=Bombardia bombarda TaxID=252184 RepID=A0AA39XBK3_9PEZI|nr:nucleotide-diphospho-sugar transferase [Bombardia bombarda]
MSPPASPLSPLSPKMGSFPAKLRNRVPTQMRRAIPLYITCLIILFFVLNADVLAVPRPNSVLRRHSHQKPLAGSTQPPPPAGFPRKVWQSWKVDPFTFDKRDSDTARSWTTRNPGYRYEVLTDNNDMVYVEDHFGPNGFNRPDIVDMYRAINATIIKADLLRYMVMYAEGGVYADIDVEALRPIHRFVPERYNPADIDMVIGVEIDQPEFCDHPILGSKSMSFCQWTFMCKPHLPVMLKLVENIMSWLSKIAAEQNVPVAEVVLDFDEVISGTGPSAFTIAVLEEMNRQSDGGGDKITWSRFHGMDESKVVSRVLVLDVEAFAAGQGHSDSGVHNARGALVKHHYHASNWPSKHPRFSHPVYGEVERCNWDAACVKKWDDDVEAYKTLSPEEKQRKAEDRKAERARQLEEARAAQEQAIKLELLGQAQRKAEEEARKKADEDAKQALFGLAPPAQPPAHLLAPAVPDELVSLPELQQEEQQQLPPLPPFAFPPPAPPAPQQDLGLGSPGFLDGHEGMGEQGNKPFGSL